ncbi:DinB family protein [Planctomycetaceae bacterium SH139]
MDETTARLRMHQHRQWTNAKLLSAAEKLSEEQLHQSFAIGQGSVWRTLSHLMGAEYIWLEILLGNESPSMPGDLPNELVGNQLAEDGMRTMQELIQRWTILESRWSEYLAALNVNELQRSFVKASSSSSPGQRPATSVMDVLLHVCTHAHYTSAQLINIFRQLGMTELPDLMLISMAREESTAKL